VRGHEQAGFGDLDASVILTRMQLKRPSLIDGEADSPPQHAFTMPVSSIVKVMLLMTCLAGLAGCSPAGQLEVSYGEWEVLPFGVPPPDGRDQPVPRRLLRKGEGPAVSAGDLVEIHLKTVASGLEGRAAGEHDDGGGWVWIGFDGQTSGDFPHRTDPLAAALIGRHQGSVLTFAASPQAVQDWAAGSARVLPFGDVERYDLYKPQAHPRKGAVVYADRGPGHDYTQVEILRVCRGRAEQRLITLLDKTPIRIAQDLGRSHETSDPRWMFLREARWTGQCQDGRQASFEYGPVVSEPPPGRTRGLDVSQLWEPWIKTAWARLPVGVTVR
jgi:hypothetical protein